MTGAGDSSCPKGASDGPTPQGDGPVGPDPQGDGQDGPADRSGGDAAPSAAASGRARDLVRGARRAPRRPDPAGRRHHMGTVPERMPVLRPDGSSGTTRTSVVQLTSATLHRLEELVTALEAEMRAHATEGRYEEAAWARDELAAATDEVTRRRAAPG